MPNLEDRRIAAANVLLCQQLSRQINHIQDGRFVTPGQIDELRQLASNYIATFCSAAFINQLDENLASQQDALTAAGGEIINKALVENSLQIATELQNKLTQSKHRRLDLPGVNDLNMTMKANGSGLKVMNSQDFMRR